MIEAYATGTPGAWVTVKRPLCPETVDCQLETVVGSLCGYFPVILGPNGREGTDKDRAAGVARNLAYISHGVAVQAQALRWEAPVGVA